MYDNIHYIDTEMSDDEDEGILEFSPYHTLKPGGLTFDEVFDLGVMSVLCQFLSISEIQCKISRLNRFCSGFVSRLRVYDSLWRPKFTEEFMSDRDRNNQKYLNDQSKFLKLYVHKSTDKNWHQIVKESVSV